MSLWFLLHVGEDAIGSVEIVRATNRDAVMRPDTVSTYRVKINGTDSVTIDHRYGDGVWRLARDALAAAFPILPCGQCNPDKRGPACPGVDGYCLGRDAS